MLSPCITCMPFTDMDVHELDVNSMPTLYQMLSPKELIELSQSFALPECDITSEGGQVIGVQFSVMLLIWHPLHRQMCKAITSSHYWIWDQL